MKLITYLFFSLLFLSCQTKAQESDNTPAGYANVDVQTFAKLMADHPDAILLDVRTPEETALGKIAGAQELDFKAPGFADSLNSLDPTKTYLIYCRSGNRSGKACKIMAERGFQHLYNMEGGWLDWSKRERGE